MLPTKIIRSLAILSVLAITLTGDRASAQTLFKHAESGNIALLPLTACAAPAAQRTLTMPSRTPKGYGLALFHVALTAASTMDLQCYSSINHEYVNPDTFGKLQICNTVTSGVCTLIDAKFTKTVAAPEELIVRVDFLGAEEVQCIITCTAGSTQIWGRMSSL